MSEIESKAYNIAKKANWFYVQKYCKILKICPGAYIFQRSFWWAYNGRGLFSEGLIFGGKFAFQNVLGLLLEENLCHQFLHVQMIILGRQLEIRDNLISEHANFKHNSNNSIENGSLGSGWRDRTTLQILPLWTEGVQGESEECTT